MALALYDVTRDRFAFLAVASARDEASIVWNGETISLTAPNGEVRTLRAILPE